MINRTPYPHKIQRSFKGAMQNPYDVAPLIRDQIDTVVRERDATIEGFLYDFFGSYDEALKYAKFYALEELVPEISYSEEDEERKGVCRMVTEYRIRLKTPEELYEMFQNANRDVAHPEEAGPA